VHDPAQRPFIRSDRADARQLRRRAPTARTHLVREAHMPPRWEWIAAVATDGRNERANARPTSAAHRSTGRDLQRCVTSRAKRREQDRDEAVGKRTHGLSPRVRRDQALALPAAGSSLTSIRSASAHSRSSE
jgi:hypothetical protein